VRHNGIRKAAAEDKVHGVTQKPPIKNAASRLYEQVLPWQHVQ